MKVLLKLLILLLVINSEVLSCSVDGKEGIVPRNNYKIPVGYKAARVNQRQFAGVLGRLRFIYTKIVKNKYNANLIIKGDWNDDTVNAFAFQRQDRREFYVDIRGGFARHPLLTADALALVVCHEIGHHIGGVPKSNSGWASNEGQSDYFATLKCFRRYAEIDDNSQFMKKIVSTPKSVDYHCGFAFSNKEDIAICRRSALASLSLARVFESLANVRVSTVSFSRPDKTIVNQTFHSHPKPQCRLDTFFQGSICNTPVRLSVDNVSDHRAGTCSRSRRHRVGNRPRCWFKP